MDGSVPNMPNRLEHNEPFSTYMDEDIHARLKAYCKKLGLKLFVVTEKAVLEYLERNEGKKDG